MQYLFTIFRGNHPFAIGKRTVLARGITFVFFSPQVQGQWIHTKKTT